MSILGSTRRRHAAKRLAGLAAATAFIAGINAPVQSLELRVNVPVVAPKIKVPTPSLAPKVTLPALNSSKHDTMLSDKPTLSPSLQKKHDAMLSDKPTLSPPLRENDSGASAYESVVRVAPLHPVAPLLHLPSPYAVLQQNLQQNGGDPAEVAVVVVMMMVGDGNKDLSAQMQQAESQMAAKQSIRNLILQQNATYAIGATVTEVIDGPSPSPLSNEPVLLLRPWQLNLTNPPLANSPLPNSPLPNEPVLLLRPWQLNLKP
jgi:hypothetical protein